MVWTPPSTGLVKVRLHDNREDSETTWAEDLGAADDAPPGSRRVRIANVPFLHSKPTFEDVIVVSPDDTDFGTLTWNAQGASYDEIVASLAEDSGRWLMILDYEPHLGVDDALVALDVAAIVADIAVERCFAPEPARPGRVYLACPDAMTVDAVMDYLAASCLPMTFTIIHPADDDDDDLLADATDD